MWGPCAFEAPRLQPRSAPAPAHTPLLFSYHQREVLGAAIYSTTFSLLCVSFSIALRHMCTWPEFCVLFFFKIPVCFCCWLGLMSWARTCWLHSRVSTRDQYPPFCINVKTYTAVAWPLMLKPCSCLHLSFHPPLILTLAPTPGGKGFRSHLNNMERALDPFLSWAPVSLIQEGEKWKEK